MFTYSIGTIVRLASGGPDMTVVDFDEMTGRVLCAWDDGDRITQEAWFPSICLDIVREKQ
jgi:uncharacterized protein YodC (DUF2158 family)